MKIKIGRFEILELFAALYSICPYYFYIGSKYSGSYISVRNSLIVCCFVLMFLFSLGSRKKTAQDNKLFLVGIAVWVIVTVFVQLYHREFFTSAKMIILWLGILIMGFHSIDSKEKFLKLIDVVLYVSIFVSLLGLVEEVTRWNPFALINTVDAEFNYNELRFGILRLVSFTSHAISYCCYCMFILALAFYRITLSNKKIYVIAYILCALNALLTISRITLLGIIASQFLLLLFYDRKKFVRYLTYMLIALAIALIFGIAFSSTVRKLVLSVYYMVMVFFDSSYVTKLRSMGMTDNAEGFGQRLSLYSWVHIKLYPDYLLGKGEKNEFGYYFINNYGYRQLKESIEVEWLRTMYRYGYVGLAAEIFFFVATVISSFVKNAMTASSWENKISFAKVFLILIICYIVVLFGVMQNEEMQLFFIIITLFMSYISHNGFNETSEKDDKTIN